MSKKKEVGYWDYRMIIDKNGDFTIRDVYYDKKGSPHSWAVEPQYPVGETEEDLKLDYLRLSEAFTKPALKESKRGKLDILVAPPKKKPTK